MGRTLAALIFALLCCGAAAAQPVPGDGSGVQRDLQGFNNSGQAGTVTLRAGSGGDTLVVVELHGTLPGRPQSVRILRGRSCDELEPPPPMFILADLRNGWSRSAVGADVGKLLSGNYNLVILSSTTPGAAKAACGHL